MTGMLLGEIAKVLTQRAEHRFGGTLLGSAAKGLMEAPRKAEHEETGHETVDLHIAKLPPSRDPVPILKQILRILQTLAMKLGILPKPAPGSPPPLPLGAQLRQLGQTVGQKAHGFFQTAEPTQERTAHIHMREIGRELARRRGITFAEAPKGGAGGTASSIGPILMRLGRLAGVVGLVTGALSLMYSAAKEFVTGVAANNRELARWNATIAASVSKLDVTRMRLEVQQAGATQGSATQLNEQLESLLIEVQPIRQGIGTLVNGFATNLVLMARLVVYVSKLTAVARVMVPLLGVAQDAAKLLEEIAKKDKPAGLPLNIFGDLQKQRQAAALQPLPGQGKKPQFIQPLPVQPRKKR